MQRARGPVPGLRGTAADDVPPPPPPPRRPDSPQEYPLIIEEPMDLGTTLKKVRGTVTLHKTPLFRGGRQDSLLRRRTWLSQPLSGSIWWSPHLALT
jgi:hypothetical protein